MGENENMLAILNADDADDVIILAETEEDLQKMVQTILGWGRKWRNKNKSSVVHFRNPQVPCIEFDYRLSGKTVKTVYRYKYI